MPLQRLRRILNTTHRVRVESSDRLVAKVDREIAARRQNLQAKGAPIPDCKSPNPNFSPGVNTPA